MVCLGKQFQSSYGDYLFERLLQQSLLHTGRDIVEADGSTAFVLQLRVTDVSIDLSPVHVPRSLFVVEIRVALLDL